MKSDRRYNVWCGANQIKTYTRNNERTVLILVLIMLILVGLMS